MQHTIPCSQIVSYDFDNEIRIAKTTKRKMQRYLWNYNGTNKMSSFEMCDSDDDDGDVQKSCSLRMIRSECDSCND